MEILHPAGSDRAEYRILPALLQVALSAGGVLRAVQPGVSLSDKGGFLLYNFFNSFGIHGIF